MTQASQTGNTWVIGGDFNLLPLGKAYSLLPKKHQAYYNPVNEITPLFRDFQGIPTQAETDSTEREKWFTHFPNDPTVKAPDRTIDYLFFPKNIQITQHYVRQKGTLRISDHLPVVAEFVIP